MSIFIFNKEAIQLGNLNCLTFRFNVCTKGRFGSAQCRPSLHDVMSQRELPTKFKE